MNLCQRLLGLVLAFTFGMLSIMPAQEASPLRARANPEHLSPSAVLAKKDGTALFVACATANCILRFDIASRTVFNSIRLSETRLGMAVAHDDIRLFVTRASPADSIVVLDSTSCRNMANIHADQAAGAPVSSPDGNTVYACNRFDNDVSVIDISTRKETKRIPVQREPVAAALSKDGRLLLVANYLQSDRANTNYVAAAVSAIDPTRGKVTAEFLLPDGSGALNDLRISPDGRYAVVTHVIAQYRPAAGSPRHKWMNANALTVIDLGRMEVLASTLLDDRGRGAANPWGIAWSADGSILVVAHAGTHELSIIDWPALLKRLLELPAPFDPLRVGNNGYAKKEPASYSVPFFSAARRRVRLPDGDLGPRAVTIVGNTVYTANYFSDTLTSLDLSDPNAKPQSIPLLESGARNPRTGGDQVRKGEFYFHDATICFQGWQSCSSCHPGDGRADGLNWDLLNDGPGNPKNTKSLLLALQTPPAMWLGVRETGEAAVRAGIRHMLSTEQPEEVTESIMAYLKSLKPVPSPYLVHGKLSASAERGKSVFVKAGCADCHPPSLFTDLHQYDVGTRGPLDKPSDRFDTPTLVEVWRTAPYLHDGSAATIREVLTIRNQQGKHGVTQTLTAQEIDDLCSYVLSL